MTKKKETPLMKQYNQIKGKYPDAMLLFRVGDFYETFGKDAIKASKILDIVLTKRNNGDDSLELAGFPHHSLNTYLPKLVKAGQRVAICDQLENPKQTKTIVKRGVTELVTPGVSLNDDLLQSKTNNFLCAIYASKQVFGVSFLDISTGEFLISEGSQDYIDKLLQNLNPSEILTSKKSKKNIEESFPQSLHKFYLEDWIFKPDYANEKLTTHFKTNSLKGFGIEDLNDGIIAAGAILHYISEAQHSKLEHISNILRITKDSYVWMDRFTIQNLDIFPTDKNLSLLDVLDDTISPMGGRLLKRWMAMPLKELNAIEKRQQAVGYLKSSPEILSELRSHLKSISDIERLASKIATQRVKPREVWYLKKSLLEIKIIKNIILTSELKLLSNNLNDLPKVCAHLEKAIHKSAPINLQKGNVIAEGYSKELDELRNIAYSGKDYLEKILKRETERTGIPSLKIAMNNVFGYYIEVRNTHKDKVPEDWIRKQTLVNAERYITEELKVYESKIFSAEEQIFDIEQSLFFEIIQDLTKYIESIKKTSTTIAQIDCLCGFAQTAIQNNYTCPNLNDKNILNIKNGRHPLIEKQLPQGTPYIANDVYLNPENQQIIIITGPNMSGKSAILRQTALIVLMAQIGCFVPADTSDIGLVDKIFTRVGANDNITMGESTFMVEMNETASILNNLSDKSLILLDEIGRGTSTYDGISIAWAITEYLHNHPKRPKTLFATHYHELNDMEDIFDRIRNYNVAIKETKDNILFIRKLQKGGSAHSFGIHVAKMAGIPQLVIKKAQKILNNLEKSQKTKENSKNITDTQQKMQLNFFNIDDPVLEDIKKDLTGLELNNLTPVEALMKISEWQKQLKNNTI